MILIGTIKVPPNFLSFDGAKLLRFFEPCKKICLKNKNHKLLILSNLRFLVFEK